MTEKLERALSLRQPWAEMILSGAKDEEYRSRLTRIRGRVYIYAGKSREDISCELDDTYPRGLIVGSIEIVGCEVYDPGYAWVLKNPRRYAKPWKPAGTPQPGFWKPRRQ